MRLPKPIQLRLASEFQDIAERVAHASSPWEQLYYFSAFFGEASRLLNQAWDRDLILIHATVQKTHELINARWSLLSQGQAKPIELPENLPKELSLASLDLAAWVADEKRSPSKLVAILGRFSELSFSTTGNGWYLYAKGKIKI